MGGDLGTTHGAAVFVCRWGLLWGGGALEQHMGPQSLFAGGGCCGGGPWNNTRGRSLCLQVGVVVGGGALEQHMGPQSLFAGQAQSNIQGFVLFCEACNLICLFNIIL